MKECNGFLPVGKKNFTTVKIFRHFHKKRQLLTNFFYISSFSLATIMIMMHLCFTY